MQQKRKTKIILDENIEWLLNLTDSIPRFELLQSNFQPLHKALAGTDCLLKASLYTFSQESRRFEKVEMLLYPNMIIRGDMYLILSTCNVEKKKINYKEYTALGLLVENSFGQTHLFFTQYSDLMDWQKQIKRFCKLQNFRMKFAIKERQNVPNVFACVRQKTNQVHTVQIFRHSDFEKNPTLYEQLMNEINIIMSLKHPCLLNYHSLYEDAQHLYIVYDYWVGDPLFRLVEQGLRLSSGQIARLIYQIIKFAKFLHLNHIYHGQINPQNIIVLRSAMVLPIPSNKVQPKTQSQLQIALLNFGYCEEITPHILKRLPLDWIPPEFQTNCVQVPRKIDQYHIGCTLYYLTFYKPRCLRGSIQSFAKSIEDFHVDYTQLQYWQHNPQHSQCSSSQLELLLALLHPDPKQRKEMKELANHHWFVNEEARIKSGFKQKLLPSLKTILEIRELSSRDMLSRMQRLGDNPVSIESACEDEDDDDLDCLHLISDENSQLSDYVAQLNVQNLNRKKQI